MYKTIIVACLLLLASAARAVELSVEERSGIARVAEPVTCGVPLPRGMVKSPEELVLLHEDDVVPVEIRKVSLWPDSSLRWVHLDFQASAEAGGKQIYSLDKGPAQKVGTRLEVNENPRGLTVTTGRIRVEVRRKGFNVFDRVALAGGEGKYAQELVGPHHRGLVAQAGDMEYTAARDKSSELSVESRGAMRVVLRAEGGLKSESGAELLHYICRLYFYNDSPVIRLAVTVENRDSVIENKITLQGLQVEVPTVFREKGVAVYIGQADKDISSVLGGPGSEAFIQAGSSTEYSLGGVFQGWSGGDPQSRDSDRLGWIGLGSEKGAAAVGLRCFWQMHPSSLEVVADEGMLRAGLIPVRLKKTVDLYSGVARTHYLRFAFTDRNDHELLCSLTAACQKPLTAVAEPAYYCRTSRAFGPLVERNLALYPEENRALVRRVEEEFDKGLLNMLSMVKSRTKNGVTVEGFGFLEWGDGMHHIWVNGDKDPRNIAWNGHYYDLPHITALEFYRSGKWLYYDYFLSRAWHLMDIQVTHFAPGNWMNGANRYCPPTDHVRIDPADPRDFTSAKVFVSNTTNHHKTQGLFDRYYLTGDERALEVALKAARYAQSFGAYSDFIQPRGAGFQVLTLLAAYEYSGDKEYLETAGRTFQLWRQHFAENEAKFTQGYFMVGFLLEAFTDYYNITGDKQVLDVIRQAVDWMHTNRPYEKYSNMALGIGLLASQPDGAAYLDLEKEYLETWHGVWDNPFKDFGLNGRGIARALYYFTSEAQGAH